MSAIVYEAPPLPAGGNLAEAVLGEIAGHLDRLAENPAEIATIDLLSLPMTEQDRLTLREQLGAGEVAAAIDASGPSEVSETGFAGVWWVVHRGAGDVVAVEQIVIARVPPVLLSHPADIAEAAKRLGRIIAGQARNSEEVLHV